MERGRSLSNKSRLVIFQWARFRDLYEIWLRDNHLANDIPRDSDKEYVFPDANILSSINDNFRTANSTICMVLS